MFISNNSSIIPNNKQGTQKEKRKEIHVRKDDMPEFYVKPKIHYTEKTSVQTTQEIDKSMPKGFQFQEIQLLQEWK